MIFKKIFIGFGIITGNLYFRIKMFSRVSDVRAKNADLTGKAWNGRVVSRQLKKTGKVIDDEHSMQVIKQFLFYSKKDRSMMMDSFALLILVDFLNHLLNNR